MTNRTLRTALLARVQRSDDERGSIAFLMLVMIATAALGGLLLSSIISQSRTTRFDQTRVHSLHAAQAGVDVVLGKLRAAATTGTTTGDDGKLPCDGPWGGAADGTATYSANITYYASNPAQAGATAMLCSASSGPYDPSSQSRTPRYAIITSTGVDGSGTNGASKGRTIKTTYVFQTNDVNITGGVIRIYPAGTSQWCMDAGSSPADGTAVLLQACSTSNPPIDQQVWAYRSDLSIELVSSVKTTTSGLCLDTSPTTHAPGGSAIVLRACTVPDAAVCPAGYTPTSYHSAYPSKTCNVSSWNQQWSVDDNAHLQGANTGATDTDGYCINVASQAANIALTLASCAGTVTDTSQTWVPSPTTGAGMAGAGNTQLVNYKQFATCLDVTGKDVNAAYLILYTCKQNPNPSNVAFNQKFTPAPALDKAPTPVLLEVTKASTTYCLKSPLSVAGYPVLSTPCPASVTAAAGTGFVWTVSQKYSNSAGTIDLAYADKYTIKDATRTAADPNGLCLGPGLNSDLYIGQYYKAIVTHCDGSTGQKWNADASLDAATLTDTHETDIAGG